MDIDPWLIVRIALPPHQLARIINLVEDKKLTTRKGKELLELVWHIGLNQCFPARDEVPPSEDPYLWYLASQLAWDFYFKPDGTAGETSELSPDVPNELRRWAGSQQIFDHVTACMASFPKELALYKAGKTGPFIGRLLKASNGCLDPEDIPEII